jgi:hypothetical protein
LQALRAVTVRELLKFVQQRGRLYPPRGGEG